MLPAHTTHALCPLDRMFFTIAVHAADICESMRRSGVQPTQGDKTEAYLDSLEAMSTVPRLKQALKKSWRDCGFVVDGVYDKSLLAVKPVPSTIVEVAEVEAQHAGQAQTIEALARRMPNFPDRIDTSTAALQSMDSAELVKLVQTQSTQLALTEWSFTRFAQLAKLIELRSIGETTAAMEHRRTVRVVEGRRRVVSIGVSPSDSHPHTDAPGQGQGQRKSASAGWIKGGRVEGVHR